MRILRKFSNIILLISLSVWLAACGGGGGSPATVTISGKVSTEDNPGAGLSSDLYFAFKSALIFLFMIK